ncbi:nucleotidyltransferase family protein [Chitinophaga oryziterrae]|uniref:nucleotidyltransferase family protein n=1 Tax=Chitinophaga oryziterrae TaxID=1031224 RepID=UPI0012F754C4
MEIKIIKERYNTEIAFLVLCCRVFLKTADKEVLVSFIADSRINWKKVYDLSTVHRIRPLVFNVLFPVKELVEEETFILFRSFCMNFSSRIFSRKVECDRITNILRQQGIHTHPYKGFDLAAFIYKDISLRECADIDVIIAEKDIIPVVDILKNEGYEMGNKDFYNRFPKQYYQQHKDVCFDKKGAFGGTFNFEFHFRLSKYSMNTNVLFSQLLGDDYLSPEREYDYKDYYKLLLINNGVSDYYPTLRSLLDLTFFNAEEPGPELERFDLLGRILSGHLFNTPFPLYDAANDQSLNYTSRFLLNELLGKQKTKKADFLRNVYLDFRFSNNMRLKLTTLLLALRFLIAPNGNDISGMRLPFYFLYYFTKVFRLTTRLLIRFAGIEGNN